MSSLLLATVLMATVYGALWHNQPARRRNSDEPEEQTLADCPPHLPFFRKLGQQARRGFIAARAALLWHPTEHRRS